MLPIAHDSLHGQGRIKLSLKSINNELEVRGEVEMRSFVDLPRWGWSKISIVDVILGYSFAELRPMVTLTRSRGVKPILEIAFWLKGVVIAEKRWIQGELDEELDKFGLLMEHHLRWCWTGSSYRCVESSSPSYLARHSLTGTPEWQLREWNSLKTA
jgi:hypothetical protein